MKMSSVHWDHFNNRGQGSGRQELQRGGGRWTCGYASWNQSVVTNCTTAPGIKVIGDHPFQFFPVLWKEVLTVVHPNNMEGARGPGPGEGSLALRGLRGTLWVNRDERGSDRWLTDTVSMWHLLLCRMWPQKGRNNRSVCVCLLK